MNKSDPMPENFSELPPELREALSETADLSEDERGELLSRAFSPPDMSVRGLQETHADLCSHLEGVSLVSAVRLNASLDVLPKLQDNSIRIHVLLLLAFTSCHGDRQASVADLRSWVECLKNSPVASQEDPPEDVFVGYVCSEDGGFRIFPGLISHADFILERLLVFMHEKLDFPGFGEVYDDVINLLKLSEAVAEELELPRYFFDRSRPEEDLSLPEDSRIEKHAQAIFFSQTRLKELGIERDKLESFVFDLGKVEDLKSEGLFGSSVERRPLIDHDGGVLVASPSSICRAAVMLILEVTPRLGGWAETFFEKESAEFFVNQVLRSVGVKPMDEIRLPGVPSCLPPLYAAVGQFDLGMPVLAFSKTSSIIQGSDLEEGETFSDEQVDAFTQYISESCELLEGLAGFKGGLILLSLSGVGRSVALGLKELRPQWHLFSAALADWHTLAGEHDFTARRLWYLGIQQKMATEANVELMNLSGLLNLYAFWKQSHFSLLPSGMDPKNPHNMMLVGGECSQPVNAELKNTSDRHCLWHPLDKEWVQLRRKGIGLNPNLNVNRVYGDYKAVSRGLLRGCVALGDSAWWVEAARPKNPDSFDLVYRLWDCVTSWCERIILSLATDYTEWIPGSVVINLDLKGIEHWDLQSIPENMEEKTALFCGVDKAEAKLHLTIEEQFLTKFNQPDNAAEREIVSVLIGALVRLCGCQVSSAEIDQCMWKVVKDERSRFFHVLRASTLESSLGKGKAEPLIIPDEELARIGIGLAHTVDKSPPECITDRDEVRKFLDRIVVGIQACLSAKLKEFSLLSIVSHSFQQLDELSRDGTLWSLSTRALLSLEDHAEWLKEHLRVTNGRSTLTEISNRALIETAVYSCDSSSREVISQTEHLSMLAEIATMIQIAGYRDAVANGLVDAEIKIHPNGQVEYDDDFQQKVMQPYLTSRLDDRIRWDAESYETNWVDLDSEAYVEDVSQDVVLFEQAFLAEFGFAHETLDKLLEVFSEFAVRMGEGGGTLDDALLRQLLKNGIGLSDEQVEVFLDRFVLRIRPVWNKDLPDGCEPNDVLPWRFFRALSILVRPIVEVDQSPSVYAISATHLHRWRYYFTNTLLEGYLPERMFNSEEMRSYLGGLAKRKGGRFEKNVAEEMEKRLPQAQDGVKMRGLGKADADPSDDVDVVAWDEETEVVFLVECKHLKPTLTVAQVIKQLENFRGDQTNSEDSLAKHLRRIRWLKSNPEGVSRLTGISPDNILWVPLLVTSGRVPMSFLDAIDYPKEQVLAFQDLENRILSIVADLKSNAPTSAEPSKTTPNA